MNEKQKEMILRFLKDSQRRRTTNKTSTKMYRYC